MQQELNDSQTRYKQLLLTAPYAANAQDSAEISKQLKAEQEKIQSLKSELEPLTVPSTNAERDSLIQRMNAITENEGYATTVELADAVTQEKQKTRQRLHQLDQELGNAARFYDSGERAWAVTKGALKQVGASYEKLLSTTMGANNQLYERSPEIYKAVITNGQPWMLPEDYSPDAEKMREDYQRINDKAKALNESAAKDLAQAKEGLNALGQAGVDISTNLIQMGIDAAGRAAGLGMLPFFARAAGGSMLEAEQEGADSWGQLGYGLTKGAIEVGTEKLFDGLAGVFGKGAADDVIEGLIGKLSGSNTGHSLLRAFAGAAGEGTEEVISDLLDPFAKLIYNDRALKEAWENRAELRSQMLYDYLIGAAMGGLGSVAGVATGQYAEKNAVLAGMDGQVQAQMETAPLVQTPVQTKAQTQTQAKARAQALQDQAPQPGTEQKNTALEQAESTAVNTDPAQHTAVEQAVIDEYQAAVDDRLVEYIETVRDNKGAKIERYTLKPVADRAAQDIMRLTGVDVSGNQTAIEARIVEHILKRHGENGTANHSMRDINDIARIQYVLDNYDTASYGGKTQAYRTMKENGRSAQANTVIFSKAVNGTYYVVEAVPDTKAKTVFVASAYMSSKKTGDAQAADADAWRVTSETKVVRSPAVEVKTSTKDIIVQSGKNYHNNFQASLETGNIGERSGKGAPWGGAGTRSVTEGGTTAASDQAAKTDSAALVLQQQYQTEIAAALEAGDYPHALKLFNEFGNPNLRALNEAQTQMSFAFFFQSEGMGKIKSYGESEDITNRTGKAEANGRFLNKSEKLYRYAPMIKPIDSFEDFTCHADPHTFYIDMAGEGKEKDFIELSPADYAEAIRNSKTYRGGNIRLISCQAGALENGAAQQVADALQVIVMAPTEIVNVDENGEMFLTDNEILAEIWYDADREERAKFKETGKWLTFYPRKE